MQEEEERRGAAAGGYLLSLLPAAAGRTRLRQQGPDGLFRVARIEGNIARELLGGIAEAIGVVERET